MSSLYRKYRPKNFSEVVGQKHIVQTLSNAIIHNRVGHAYLFTGPRGTGKTSFARIFAKTVNCKKLKNATACGACDSCTMIQEGKALDIIEIDAASNTGVDNIRELRDTINLLPTSLAYKVYIIDEVHMLSTGAFNALLKTLEEPPAHAIFILATTEIHKVPETIISRCQRFDFPRFPIEHIIEKLSFIAREEKVDIDKESLEMIAIASEGAMRDAESLLTQIMALEDKVITVKEVEEILGATDKNIASEMAEMIIANDAAGAIGKINTLLHDGYDLQVFNKSFINYLRQLMLVKINSDLGSAFSYELTKEQMKQLSEQAEKASLQKIVSSINLFLEAHNKISAFILPQLPLEIAIIKATGTLPIQEERSKNKEESGEDVSLKLQLKTQSSSEESLDNSNTPKNKDTAPDDPVNQQFNNVTIEQCNISIDEARSNWKKLLEAIAAKNHSLKVLLTKCQIAAVSGNEISIATSFDFYKEKLDNPNNKLTVEEVFGSILGQKIRINAVTNKEAGLDQEERSKNKEVSDVSGEQSSLLSTAMEMFGGKIV